MNVNISVPDEVFRTAEEAARHQHVPVETVLESAVIEQLRAWEALTSRAARGDVEKFRAVLAKVPDIDPEPGDQL